MNLVGPNKFHWSCVARIWSARTVKLRRTLRGPDAVSAHPKGSSPFGATDRVGNVWQWADEFLDEHTRGGSYYQP
jgi:formylglycine-generating enzyme required for sulfatase activity